MNRLAKIKFLLFLLAIMLFFNSVLADTECAFGDCSIGIAINVIGPEISFTGFVKDLAGELIANSSVSVDGTSYSTAASSGNYNLADIPSGFYNLTASADGYLSQTKTNQLTIEGATAVVDFMLSQTGGIKGKVFDFFFGTGITNANVTLKQFGEDVDSALTNAAGSYSFTGLAPGYYDIHVSAAGYTSNSKPGVQVFGGKDTNMNLWIW